MDIYLLIGQSNMSGRGRLTDVPPLTHSQVRMFRDGRWLPAVEPLHTDKPMAGVGLAMTFALEMLHVLPSSTIGLVPAAVGGTALHRWMPGAEFYTPALAACQAALDTGGVLRGILWHQGEADSGTEAKADSYAARLLDMLTTLRRDLNAPCVPIVAGELGHFLARRPGLDHHQLVNQRLHQLRTLLPAFGVASAADLGDNGDSLHFNAASLRIFGRRYAKAFQEVM